MKIAVIGANGKAGSLILEEGTKRGHFMTAILRNKNKLTKEASKVIEKDIFDLNYEDIKDQDVIIDAFGAWSEETLPLHKKSAKHLMDILKDKEIRIIFVGGAGSLFVNEDKTLKLMDTRDFPEEFKPLAKAMSDAFDEIKMYKDVNWTYISPSANFDFNREETGKYKTSEDNLLYNLEGESVISYKDYAKAVIDEAENNKFNKKRFTVCEI